MKTNLLKSLCIALTCCAGSLYAQSTCDESILIEPGVYEVPEIDEGGVPIPVCAPNGLAQGGGMWYRFSSDSSFTARIYTSFIENFGIDNRVHVYTGDCDNLVCVAGDDDSGTGFLCEVIWAVEEGLPYYVAFDDRWDNSGFIFEFSAISVEEPVTPPIGFNTVTFPELSRCLGTVDMDGDYLDDLMDVSNTQVFLLLQQEEGEVPFEFVNYPTEQAQFPYVWSIAAGDIDGDGYNDLVYGGGAGVSFMFRNPDGQSFSTFSTPDYVFSQRSNFVDLNNDGHLDAFVCHDVAPNVYYMNDGEGNLSFNQGGLSDVPDGGNYGSIWVDYNNDGLVDLFIAKCRGGVSAANYNQLFRNDGDGNFTDVSEEAGLYDPVQTWSSAWGDFDNDGWMDVLVGGSSGPHRLMRNNGDGTFTDITEGSGFESLLATGTEWVAYDFDNDGLIDILGANGHLCFNNGDMSFTCHTYPNLGNGPVGDFNNDGFLDIGNNNFLHYNEGNENNWLKINTQGLVSNVNGIGARLELYTPSGKQIRDVQSGVGFRFMHTLNVHFGMGEEEQIDSLVVNWPSGIVDVHSGLSPNQFVHLVEGEEFISDTTLSTSSPSIEPLKIYPNPTRDMLFIDWPRADAGAIIRVYDIHGRMLHQSNFAAQLSTAHLPQGLYIIELQGEAVRLRNKFIRH